MEICELRLLVTESDLNEFLRGCSFPDAVRDPAIAVVPEGIRFRAVYQTVVGVPFEMLWQVSAIDGLLVARLATIKAGFLPLGFLKKYLLNAIAAAAGPVELRDDTLVCDVDRVLQERGLPLRTHLSAIRCADGSLIVESGAGGGAA